MLYTIPVESYHTKCYDNTTAPHPFRYQYRCALELARLKTQHCIHECILPVINDENVQLAPTFKSPRPPTNILFNMPHPFIKAADLVLFTTETYDAYASIMASSSSGHMEINIRSQPSDHWDYSSNNK